MAGNFADLTAVLTLDSTRFSEEAARVKKELGETSDLADLMAGRVSQSFKKQATAVEQGLSRQALAAQKAGISVGQYKAAMRTLPAQFTDIATQLAGGQDPWLILLQQGGQVEGRLRRDDPHVQGACRCDHPADGRGHLAGGGDRCAGVCLVPGGFHAFSV